MRFDAVCSLYSAAAIRTLYRDSMITVQEKEKKFDINHQPILYKCHLMITTTSIIIINVGPCTSTSTMQAFINYIQLNVN